MENKRILLSALLFSGTLILGVPMSWSQGVKGEGTPPGKEGGTPKKERVSGRESRRAASEEVKQAQQALKDKGHDPGPIDGVLGPKTQAALKAFQEANKTKATGRLDAETKSKLGLSGAGGMGKESEKRESRESPTGPGK
jgi:peptidoglycan hydrolase-like protein with peptidoglycan-binding domain